VLHISAPMTDHSAFAQQFALDQGNLEQIKGTPLQHALTFKRFHLFCHEKLKSLSFLGNI
jgi:hypothetical protein